MYSREQVLAQTANSGSNYGVPLCYRSLSAPSLPHAQAMGFVASQSLPTPTSQSQSPSQESYFNLPPAYSSYDATMSPFHDLSNMEPHLYSPQQHNQQPPQLGEHYAYQPIHPFQPVSISSSTLESSTAPRVKFEFTGPFGYPNHSQNNQSQNNHPLQEMDDVQSSSLTGSPLSSTSDELPSYGATFSPPSTTSTSPSGLRPHSMARIQSLPFFDSNLAHPMELSEEFSGYMLTRHGSLGSVYPVTHSHELLESTLSPPGGTHTHMAPSFDYGVPMVPSLSATSISSTTSTSLPRRRASTVVTPSSKPKQQRRASLSPDASTKLFSCIFDDCGKLFKRSEHLKRHVRSVHTLEKPFLCPYQGCPKRFSRSDNLNQHIRIHRHDKDKGPKPFASFTPFQVSHPR
ncbi:hypothetical protein BGZ59_010478 [Podila verticillata]|nr:hypothetical protein BGZ59_010478 [Podila verticillata]